MTDATCLSCGSTVGHGARFCASCGAPLESASPAVEARKTVTALFCDVTGSTALGERLDPESLHAVMETYFATVGTALRRHDATVEKFAGDAVMAVFGVPVVHEDDATRACRAAVEVLSAVADLDRQVEPAHGVRFEVRIGIETGEVLVGDPTRGSTFASGPAVNIAARLEQAARPGECLIGPACRAMAGDQVVVEERPGLSLRGVTGPVSAFRLLDVHSLTDREDRQDGAPLVGRTRELGLLLQTFDRAATDRTCQLVTLLGPAGIGKTRLVSELMTRLEPAARVLRGRCLSYGEGVTYWPLVEVVRQAAGLTGAETGSAALTQLAEELDGTPEVGEVVDTLAAVAGLGGSPGSVDDNAWAVQSLLEALARSRPVLLVVDDLHWAEPGMLDVVESVCEWSRDAPILVIALARPELLDDRPGWGAGTVNSVSILLEPLHDDEADMLVDRLVGDQAFADELRREVRDRSGGNPLFVEQMVRMLAEEDGRGGGADVTVPPTITALLAARLDRLTAQEREVIGPAAVVGEVFYPTSVAEMTGLPQEDVSRWLRSMVRKGLLGPSRSDLPGQQALRFGHALVRDTAYDALPKASRAALHERFARWLDKHTDGPAYDDLVGSHLEAAHRNRADLGALDEDARRIGAEAADRLATAGLSLLYTADVAAVALLQRAEQLLPDGPVRWAVQVDLVNGLTQSLQLQRAVEVAERVRDSAAAAADRRWTAHAGLALASVLGLIQPEGSGQALRREVDGALAMFTETGDDLGLYRTHAAMVDLAVLDLQWSAVVRELELASAYADRVGRNRHAQILRSMTVSGLILGDCPADEGLRESRSRAVTASGRMPRFLATVGIATFATLLGDDEAAAAKELAERRAAELRSLNAAVTVAFGIGTAELTVGQHAEAARIFAECCERLIAAGEAGILSTVAGLHAHAALAADRPDTAQEQVEVALRASSEAEDIVTQALAQSVQGWLAALDGDRSAAERHGFGAVALLQQTDALMNRALVHVACAEAATVLGDRDDARRHREAAIALYRAKGSPVAVARQEALLER